MEQTSMTGSDGETYSCIEVIGQQARFVVGVSDAAPDDLKAVCWDYWKLTPKKDDMAFKEEELANRLGPNAGDLWRIAFDYSEVLVVDAVCSVCHHPVRVVDRPDMIFFNAKEFMEGGAVCENCEQQRHSYVFRSAHEAPPVDTRTITLIQAVKLLSVIKFLGNESLDALTPYIQCGTAEYRLSPSADYDHDVLVELFRGSLIKTDSRTPQNLITFDDENRTFSVPLRSVILTMPGPHDKHNSKIASAYHYLEALLDKGQFGAEDIATAYQEIALHECLAYLELVMDDHGFEFTAGEKSTRIIQSGLQHFSVAQLYGLIWRAGRDTAAARARHPMTKENAVTAGVNNLERSIERAALNGWELNPFKRDRRLPESVISRVFSGSVIKQDDAVFNMTLAQIQQSRGGQ